MYDIMGYYYICDNLQILVYVHVIKKFCLVYNVKFLYKNCL